ncbi:MAG: glycosyltransferase family 39 protein [Anaerolineae bacterium]|nr:glycosyltransferase family 39 protein [Anaerolineae bacterium]
MAHGAGRPELTTVRTLWLLVGVLALAFVLRVIALDTIPLRGDEAFAVRVWAGDPDTVLRDLADEEPHPLGTFFGFYAWKHTAGDSEFAMRCLPLLGNLLGVAAVAALARRLCRDNQIVLLAALLWAIHPHLIWHAQDVRNYAIWSGLSPLALWLFLRAADSNRPRDWALYVLAETVVLYIFFLEAFLLPVQGLYLLLLRRRRSTLKRATVAWGALAILLIPWIIQAWFLSGSGYRGATANANPAQLFTWILPTLLTGDTFAAPWDWLLPLAWIALAGITLWLTVQQRRLMLWIALWIALPTLLLLFAATRMSVFHPRYLIALTPALIIITARALVLPARPAAPAPRIVGFLPLLLIATPLLGFNTLIDYYQHDPPKAPDWPALTTYLEHRAQPGDLILQTLPDPAFVYYYDGAADEIALTPETDTIAQLQEVDARQTIWLVGRNPTAEDYLDTHMQRVSFHTIAEFSVMQFRDRNLSGDEVFTPADATFGEIAHLNGYTVQGPDPITQTITVLLYWEPKGHITAKDNAETGYKVFVHLAGPPNPAANGSPLWDQDDHFPFGDRAATTRWEINTPFRDTHHLLEDPTLILAPGQYTLLVGFYDETSNERLPVTNAQGDALGNSYPITTITIP